MSIRLGEPIFRSVQGEGNRTGVLSIWMRYFGCNLQCSGFFQDEPSKPDTWEIPEALNNGKIYKSLKDVPILHTGCDSGYSWHPNFKHLAIDRSVEDIVYDIDSLTYNGSWIHSVTDNMIDLCITGGEPMMQQRKTVKLIQQLESKYEMFYGSNCQPVTIQIETNGTKPLEPGFKEFVSENYIDINWNISPKLFNVSGEIDKVNYDIIRSYQELTFQGCLKFVVNDRDETWNELNEHVKNLRSEGVWLPIYIMPVGATYEQQTDTAILTRIANRAVENGYHVSGRLQAVLFSNGIGT